MKKKIDLSIIMPAYNEEENLRKCVDRISREAKKLLNSHEIIIVNDGSSDRTLEIAGGIVKKNNFVKLINHINNKGVGASISDGIRSARMPYITHIASDGQMFLEDIKQGIEKASEFDVVVLYRTDRPDYTFYRKILSFCMTNLMNLLFSMKLKDYNWVHIYKKNIFKKVKLTSTGVFFYGEVLAKAHQNRYSIGQAWSNYRPRMGGKAKNARMSVALRTLFDMLGLFYTLKFKDKNIF